MSFDEFYCSSVANSDAAAACERWLQVGRDHRWAPPPASPPGFDWTAWVPALAAVVVVVTLARPVDGPVVVGAETASMVLIGPT